MMSFGYQSARKKSVYFIVSALIFFYVFFLDRRSGFTYQPYDNQTGQKDYQNSNYPNVNTVTSNSPSANQQMPPNMAVGTSPERQSTILQPVNPLPAVPSPNQWLEQYSFSNAAMEWAQNKAEKAGVFAQSFREGLNKQMQQAQLANQQREQVERFYTTLGDLIRPLKLSEIEQRELIRRIENIYIEDGRTGKYGLDPVYLRDMSNVVRKEYSQIMLEQTHNGVVDTYGLNGALKTRWEIKNARPHGSAVTYYENGEIQYIDIYDHGRKLQRKKYDREGKLEFLQDYDYTYSSASLSHEPENVEPVNVKKIPA